MSEKKRISKTQSNIFTVIFSFIAVFISVCRIVVGLSTDAAVLPALMPASGILGTLLLFVSVSCLITLKGKKALCVTAVSIALAIIVGGYSGNILEGILTAMSFLAVGFCAFIVFKGYKSSEQKSTLCTYTAFVFTVFELLRIGISISITALRSNVKFTTMLFGTLEGIINSYIGYYTVLLENAAKLSPELYTQVPTIDTSLFYSSMATLLALSPAILYVGYFVISFITTTLLDRFNRKYRVLSGKKFSSYDISLPVYFLFMIFGTIYIFSMFFEYTLSGFTIGVLSVVLALFPHFVILAYHRMYIFFSKLSGKFGAIIFLLIISGAGFIFLAQIYLYVLAFIGTSEYRRKRFEENKNKFYS